MEYEHSNSLAVLLKILRPRHVFEFLKFGLTFIPGKLWKLFCSDMWLITENADTARDNGYWLFRYIRENHPDRKVYYIIRKDVSDYNKVRCFGNVIRYRSLLHYMVMWAVTVFIGTTKNHGFPDEATGEFLAGRHICGFRYVFLNHGVARGHSYIVDGRYTYYDMLIAISEQEKQTMVALNNQDPEKIHAIGFCRHDNLDDSLLDRKMILFMPTWRNWLDFRHESDPDTIESIKKAYFQSPYYQRCSELVQSRELAAFLEEHDLHLIMYLHNYAQAYTQYFHPVSDRIRIAHKEEDDIQELLKRAAYLITDYSSVIFDFAYMKKPCCYYQFDAEEFARNQYAESEYFSYRKDGFGPVFSDLDQVIKDLKKSCDTGFVMENMYRERVENYFPSFGKDHCERTYALICSLRERH